MTSDSLKKTDAGKNDVERRIYGNINHSAKFPLSVNSKIHRDIIIQGDNMIEF